MKNYAGATFRGERAWSGPNIANFASAVVKLRWTDTAFHWHVNTGEEVFAVLDGIVDMHVREAGVERIITLRAGDVLHIESGEEHVAHPRGEARILVVEQPKSA